MPELALAGLRVTVEMVRRGSFTAAAAVLGTQSAISRKISATEAAAGQPTVRAAALAHIWVSLPARPPHPPRLPQNVTTAGRATNCCGAGR
ncbi:LysR family transcriptional regulator [Micromonospora sp. KC213]|nr:LysR family transcriptional regulator [Micromonospora sp. KC213]